LPPLLAFVRGPAWDRAEPQTREAFAELKDELADRVVEVELPESAQHALDWHRTIMEAEMAFNLDAEWERGRERLSASLREQLARGRELRALDYRRAVAGVPRLAAALDELFDRFDAIVTPATAGTAPPIASTGDPAFGTLWTLVGAPALSLPLMTGTDGLPLGVQLVGRREDDARLLRTARWLERHVAGGGDCG
jgi:Asp-tRNA(Asn)/Glu-tRNA(Gln) amidotransferase A subunit family amidase